MKILDYLKDRVGSYIIVFLGVAIVFWMFLFFHVPWFVDVFTFTIVGICFALIEIINFIRKKKFYDQLMNRLSELDQKYLLSEVIDVPELYESKVLYEVLYETGKSMTETIASYKRESRDFREFIELWVHEIKLPVASIQLMAHNDGNKKYLTQLSRIDSYIENVLYYARSESAEKDYMIRKISLKRVFADVAVRYREELQARGISLQVKNLDIDVLTDGKWLSYMFVQLMSNSMKYMKEGRDAQIIVYAEDFLDKTVFHFRDNGIGINESDLPHIFEKSFTGSNGRNQAKSTGMGLYLVAKLCHKLGHKIDAKSVEDEYTEIIITFGKNTMFSME